MTSPKETTMRIRGIICVVTVAAILMASCATIVSGTTQNIYIETPEVEGASCELSDSMGGHRYLPRTPGSVMVPKGYGAITVRCRKEGYETKVAEVVATTAHAATFGNVLFGGVVGVIIDSTTGASRKYPDKLVMWMKPSEFASKEEEAAWLRRSEGYEAMFEEPAAAGVEALEAPLVDPAMKVRIVEYLDNNMRDFQRAMREYDSKNLYSFSQRQGTLLSPTVRSYEVWEVNEKRIVLRVIFKIEQHPRTKLLLVRWAGSGLEIVAQRDAPRKEAATW